MAHHQVRMGYRVCHGIMSLSQNGAHTIMRLVIRSVGVNGSMEQMLDFGVGLMMRKAKPIFVTASEVQF